MAEIMRMRKFLAFISSVRVQIQLNLQERLLDSFSRAITWAYKKFIMAEIMRMRKIPTLITSVGVQIQLNLQEHSIARFEGL